MQKRLILPFVIAILKLTTLRETNYSKSVVVNRKIKLDCFFPGILKGEYH